MKKRKLNQLRRMQLLAIVAGCNRLEFFPSVAILVDALKESRDKRSSLDPLYKLPAKTSEAIHQRLIADLSVLEQQHWVQRKSDSYYELSGQGTTVATTIGLPVWGTEVITRATLRRAQFSHPLF